MENQLDDLEDGTRDFELSPGLAYQEPYQVPRNIVQAREVFPDAAGENRDLEKDDDISSLSSLDDLENGTSDFELSPSLANQEPDQVPRNQLQARRLFPGAAAENQVQENDGRISADETLQGANLIQENDDCSSADEALQSEDETEQYFSQLSSHQQKSVHLVTWSQANDLKLASNIEDPEVPENPRQAFGQILESYFKDQIRRNAKPGEAPTQLEYWACAREAHKNGGFHYHCSIKFSKRMRWMTVSKRLISERGIHANFQSFPTNYSEAWQYINKEDKCVVKSESHPKMMVLPSRNFQLAPSKRHCSGPLSNQSQAAEATGSQGSSSQIRDTHDTQDLNSQEPEVPLSPLAMPPGSSQKTEKARRLTKVQVACLIIDNNIKSEDALYLLSREYLEAEQPELANFLINHSGDVSRLIKTSWLIQDSKEVEERERKTRLEQLEGFLEAEHAVDAEHGFRCDGKWLTCAMQILERNNIDVKLWQEKFQNCLRYGRNKMNNIFLLGVRNCGKTFLLRPLNLIYKTFCNPASGSFNWIGAQNSEVILLNDFRYPAIDKGADRVISWQDLLNLLDKDKLTIAAPKNHYAADIEWSKRQPIFGNGPFKIKYVRYGEENSVETEMMDARVYYFQLRHPIPDDELDNTLIPCSRCFANLILDGPDMYQ